MQEHPLVILQVLYTILYESQLPEGFSILKGLLEPISLWYWRDVLYAHAHKVADAIVAADKSQSQQVSQ